MWNLWISPAASPSPPTATTKRRANNSKFLHDYYFMFCVQFYAPHKISSNDAKKKKKEN
jgi:hypothetical protein